MIEAIGLTKQYSPERVALKQLDLTVRAGEIYCLLGENGAGKTTTLNIFLNFIRPTAGRAVLNGIDVNVDPIEAKRHVAYLSENVTLYGRLRVDQNLEFFSRLSGKAPRSRDEHFDLLRKVGLPERAFGERVKNLSKGMRQKVGLAIAIAKDAPALLLDEPMSGLDPDAAATLVDILKWQRELGKAILISTHDIFRAKELANRIGIMRDGRKVWEQDRTTLASTNLEALYLEHVRGERVAAPAPQLVAVGGPG
jgi:ABC-2 type transport system ATP-binding protein